MATRLLITLVLASLLSIPTLSDQTPADIKSWCSQTPFPKTCEHYMSTHKPRSFPPKTKSDFKKMAIQLALDQALHAQSSNMRLGSKCRNQREKLAWSDCLELYESTILRLNRTITPSVKCTGVDMQTWLSTALTNLETCRTGFVELGVSDYMLPLIMSNNVSELICDSLAINGDQTSGRPSRAGYKDEFPTWVSPGDRKLLQSSSGSPASRANLVVAKDGSGRFRTIKEALDAAAKQKRTGRFVIYVKAGIYNENVQVSEGLTNVMLVGDGIGKTVVTGSRSVGGGSTTFNSATVAVVGDGFMARDMTIRNTAGPSKGQAVALRSGSDLSVFYRCSFEGYQDTLYVHSERQFYRDCDIYGTVDFIFGNAAVVLQNCNIRPRRPPNRTNTITAQGRSDPNQNTGIIVINSRVTAASDLRPVQSSVRTYLGRPWREYSRTVFMQTFLDTLIHPAGWSEWTGDFALKTLFYGEYRNSGPGSSTANRVKWGGYRAITSVSEASKFTVRNFISGDSWIPSDVPFISGL